MYRDRAVTQAGCPDSGSPFSRHHFGERQQLLQRRRAAFPQRPRRVSARDLRMPVVAGDTSPSVPETAVSSPLDRIWEKAPWCESSIACSFVNPIQGGPKRYSYVFWRIRRRRHARLRGHIKRELSRHERDYFRRYTKGYLTRDPRRRPDRAKHRNTPSFP